MDPLFPQLLRFSDVALLCLRLIVALVFFESGRRHAQDPVGRAASIGLSPGFTRMLGWAELAAAVGVAVGVLTQVAALGLMLVMAGAIQKKLFVWHTGFWGEQTYGWHYDLTFLVANLVIVMTGGGRLIFL
ncbi:MAG TPA: DoxX family protein [Gemmatimonadales bacterium]|nr:DoxX family protein [Gemmatimonadales bacterium]